METSKSNPGVLLLRSSIGVFGAERVVLELAAELKGSSFTPIVGVIENRSGSHEELYEAARKAGLLSVIFSAKRPFDPMTIWHIRNFIKYNDVAIINPHGYKANFYALAAAKFTQKPCVATCHPWTETKYSARARFYTRVDKHMLARMDDIIAVSENVRVIVNKLVPGKPCRVIPNGIDLHRFNGQVNAAGYRESLWLSDDDFVIGAIGRLVPEKGYIHLIEAMQLLSNDHPQLKLLIIGDGPLNGELTREVARRQLQGNVIFTGVRDDVPQLLATMNAFVLSSISEGLPMVVLEAMAAGRPVVATTVGDVPKIIINAQNGLLAEPGDAESLARVIDWMLKNPKKAQQLGEAARQYVADHYSAGAMASQYLQVFEQFRKK